MSEYVDSNLSTSDTSHLSLSIDYPNVNLCDDFEAMFNLMADEAGIPACHIVEVIFAESVKMRELKNIHFDMDMDTDVIAFTTDNPELPAGFPALAGEMFIGLTEIQKNAVGIDWSFSEELLFVLAHGLLHLRGWDDSTDEERCEMFKEQKRILDELENHNFNLTDVISCTPVCEPDPYVMY
jgi:probable rRNA maturation factor